MSWMCFLCVRTCKETVIKRVAWSLSSHNTVRGCCMVFTANFFGANSMEFINSVDPNQQVVRHSIRTWVTWVRVLPKSPTMAVHCGVCFTSIKQTMHACLIWSTLRPKHVVDLQLHQLQGTNFRKCTKNIKIHKGWTRIWTHLLAFLL